MKDSAPRKPARWIECLGEFWDAVREHAGVLWRVRVPAFTSVALVAVFVWPDQSRDVFRGMLEDLAVYYGVVEGVGDQSGAKHLFRAILLHVTTVAGALALWFWSRQTLRLLNDERSEGEREADQRLDRRIEHLPRIVAILPIVAMAVVLLFVPTDPSVKWVRPAFGGSFLLEALVLYILLFFRRRTRVLAWTNQERSYWWMGAFGCALALVVFAGSLALREYAFQFGPIGVLWCGAAFWATLLSLLVIHGYRHRIPWILTGGIAALIFGGFNLTDNHRLRGSHATPSSGEPTAIANTSVVEGFKAWKAAHTEGPIIFVSAEGGGIYAAYHAAYLLSRLQEESDHEFGKRVFMISSVSGGSLGSGVFASLLAAQEKLGADHRINFVQASRAMFDDDLLSPVLAAGLGPDALQAFIPFPVRPFDRARAMEDTLHQRWRDLEKTWQPDGKKPLVDWSPDGSLWDLWVQRNNTISTQLPALFLNTTVVETGSRATLGPYGMPGGNRPIPNIYHLWAGATDLRVPLPAALVLSARFPVVTPVGRLDHLVLRTCGPNERRFGCADWRFGDGGYFENSGLDTLLDVLGVLDGAGELSQEGIRSRIKVLSIGSFDATAMELPNGEGLSEFLSPIRVMLRARSDRARLARIRIAAEMPATNARGPTQYVNSMLSTAGQWRAFHRVGPEGEEKQPDADIPLGWMLSESSKRSIRTQVDDPLPSRLSILMDRPLVRR